MYLLDSNIIIGFLNGDTKIGNWIFAAKERKEFLLISIMSKIEVMSLEKLTERQIEEIKRFLDSFHPIGLNDEVVALAAAIRRKKKASLGDAVVLASAIHAHATLVTNDKQFFKKATPFVNTISV